MQHYIGKVLNNRYRLTHKIGQGGMAVVYLAEDLRGFGQLVAIKQNGFSISKEDRQLFEDEARLLVELSRAPNCPRNLPTSSTNSTTTAPVADPNQRGESSTLFLTKLFLDKGGHPGTRCTR